MSGYDQTFCARVCRHHTVGLCDSYCHLVTQFGINWFCRRSYRKHASLQYSEQNFDPEHNVAKFSSILLIHRKLHMYGIIKTVVCTSGKRRLFGWIRLSYIRQRTFLAFGARLECASSIHNIKHNTHFTIL